MTLPWPRRGLLLVLSSPSGAGKTAITRELLARDPSLQMSISVTTRPMRPGEEEGRDYRFVDSARFEAMAAAGAFLEHATVHGNRYGTPRAAVEAAIAAGRDIVFDIDWQGTQQLAEGARDDLVSVFVLPPSWAELGRRLHARAQDSDAVVTRRLAAAPAEMSHWSEYEYVLVNRDLDESVRAVETIIAAERLRRARQSGLAEFVKTLQAQGG